MRARVDWAGRDVLDIGCGTGFHLPRFAADAAPVHRRRAAPRPGRAGPRGVPGPCPNVTVLAGTAQALPLPDASVDVVHARWAYFFGPGLRARAGRAGPRRTPRRHGARRSTTTRPGRRSAAWFRRGYPKRRPGRRSSGSGRRHGWTRTPVDMGWRFSSRADLEAVVRIEFDAPTADAILAEHDGHRGRLRRQPLVEAASERSHARTLRRHRRRVGDERATPRGRGARRAGVGTEQPLERLDHLDGDLLERLAHRGQPGRARPGRPGSRRSRRRRCPRRRAARGRPACAARPSRGCRTRRRTPWAGPRRAGRRSPRARGDGVLDPRGQAGGRDVARAASRATSRRAGPRRCSESLRQPIQAIRWWPRSSRCVVAMSAPAAPSTSTHGWRGVGVVPGPAERDERRPPLVEPGRLRVAEVGVGDDERVDRGGAQQVVVRRRAGPRPCGRRRTAARGSRPSREDSTSEWTNRSIAALAVPSWAALNCSPIRCEARVRRLRAARLGE